MKKDTNYFLSRKSCRNFSKTTIDFKILQEIILKASKAPTCGNMQLYSVIVTEDENNKSILAKFHYNQSAAVTAPVILTICADFHRFTKWCKINNAAAGYNNFNSFITAMTDAVIFAQQIVTIAEMEGYASCYLGTVIYNAREISEFLALPDLVVPVVSIAIGKAEEKGENTKRLPVESIIHREKYREDKIEDIKRQFEIHDNNPENAKYIIENGKDNLAQVFAEVRYPKSINEQVSESFISLLKEKGYL